MKDFLRVLRRIKWWIIGSILFLAVVQILYTIPAPSKWLEAKWEAGYFISFVGTVVLGIIAIMQTKDANNMSKRLMQLEENRYKLEIRPFVLLEDWTTFEKEHFRIRSQPDQLYISLSPTIENGPFFCIAFVLTNSTKSYVSVSFKGIRYADETISDEFWYSNVESKALGLKAGESKSIVFCGNKDEIIGIFDDKNIRLEFDLLNRFGDRYREDITALVFIPTDSTPLLSSHIIVRVFNYYIGRYMDGYNKVEWENQNGQA